MPKSVFFEVHVISFWRHMTRELRHNFRMAAILDFSFSPKPSPKTVQIVSKVIKKLKNMPF